MRRFYTTDIDLAAKAARLDANESHHLRDVLRLGPGDEVSVFDGAGHEYLCRVETSSKAGSVLSIARETAPPAPESPLALTFGSVVIPGDKYDLIVQKAVELGVVRLVPLSSARGEVKLKDLEKKLVRWRRIALDAAKQCGRARLMEIGEPTDVVAFLEGARDETRIFFSEREGAPLDVSRIPQAITAVIGPKGGWEDREIEAARSNGFAVTTLGGRIMRAETAAIALAAVLQHRFGDIN